MDKKIFPIAAPADPVPVLDTSINSRDIVAAKHMMQYARKKPQANLTKLAIENVTRKTHFALILMPKWSIVFAPYSIARLAAVTRAAGYKTSVFDWNSDSWRKLRSNFSEDPWDGWGSRDYMWHGLQYTERIEPLLVPVLEDYLQQLIELKPDVVGFSLYFTNISPTLWLIRKLRQHLPNTKIIGGGPSVFHDVKDFFAEFDHLVSGEGEELLLKILDNIENNQPLTEHVYYADKTKRINLDELPFPDYTDLQVQEYLMPNAISSELSRGCVATCTFCDETHFWKFRGRQARTLIDEIENQYKTIGSDVVWFIDSLINGNLNELRAFALGVVERGLKLKWQGYARCDGRMDLEYLKDLKDGGCVMLDFGIESGSQPVLDLMKKNITVEEVEQNCRDCAKLGLNFNTEWIVGFPNETSVDFAHTMTLAWRIRSYYMLNMARGVLNIGHLSVLKADPVRFKIHPNDFLKSWTTLDKTNTKLHRLLRFKSFNILIEQMPIYGKKDSSRRANMHETYRVQYYNNTLPKLDIVYENFDFDIIQDSSLTSSFSRTLVNEMWPLFRTLWHIRDHAKFDIWVKFDPQWDLNQYGTDITSNLTAEYKFSIDDNGKWDCAVEFNFITPEYETENFDINLNWAGSGQW
jgi:hypothetical protein